uniref:Uncharacterized protein n=1 Tax=Oryza meridionalis TaxID=40149 RepID=A0A0E0E4S6_9ORYZ
MFDDFDAGQNYSPTHTATACPAADSQLRSPGSTPPMCSSCSTELVHTRSSSFVGRHEYVAPEVARGGGHGTGMDQ